MDAYHVIWMDSYEWKLRISRKCSIARSCVEGNEMVNEMKWVDEILK